MARSSLLIAGIFLTWAMALPARAVAADDQIMAPLPVATQAPTPLQEPHAVDQAPLPPLEQAVPAKRAQPSVLHGPAPAKSGAKAPPSPRQAVATSKAKSDVAEQQARPKARPAPPPQLAAKPKPSQQATVKPKAVPRKLVKPVPRRPHMLAQVPRRSMREAHRTFEYPEERPHSGPVYESPLGAPATPPTQTCDKTCQYRDWLNRYAAWYRDFGRYYYGGAPPRIAAPDRPVPAPRAYSENRVPPPPAYRFDRSERDRLDPWHGYNPHRPTNGY